MSYVLNIIYQLFVYLFSGSDSLAKNKINNYKTFFEVLFSIKNTGTFYWALDLKWVVLSYTLRVLSSIGIILHNIFLWCYECTFVSSWRLVFCVNLLYLSSLVKMFWAYKIFLRLPSFAGCFLHVVNCWNPTNIMITWWVVLDLCRTEKKVCNNIIKVCVTSFCNSSTKNSRTVFACS